jgi:signal peptidase II
VSAGARKYVLAGILALVSLVLDQITKIWARGALAPEGSGKIIEVLGRKIYFRYAENPGVAFSMFRDLAGGRVILSLVAFGALLLVVYYLKKTEPDQTRLQAALGLVGGGAIGNLIDRAVYGVVTDFVILDFDFRPFNPWPAFNVADAALVIGVGLMALDMFRTPGKAADAAPGSATAAGSGRAKDA